MTINGTLVLSKTSPLIAKEGVVWIDTSTQIPKIKYFSGGGYIPPNDIPDLPTIPETPTWDSLEGKPQVIAAGATQAAARTAIGAGTSNLALGTSASTAAAGNHNHAITAHAASGLAAASNIQALAQALSARIKALEDAQTTPQA